MKISIAGLAVAIAVGVMVTPPISLAQAPQSGLYIGGGIGYNRFEGEDFPTSQNQVEDLEDERVSYKGIAGVTLGSLFALEGQYIQFGDFEEGAVEADVTGFTASALIHLPISSNFSLFGKAGALLWDREISINGQSAADDDGTDFTFGLGARLALSRSLGLRLDYERFTLDDTDIDTASVNLLFHF
ncbi:outer membrane beta-barrel protein [Polycyclovorans algicola]|uniref:outer membrane beta-barrel protein n=1 Tax=Polycyclovorans algicola TaxID=616992 RepID=UPI00069372E2|nr:outer membrane beta-barrel protein [Polycyclovorans algicola]